MKEILNRMESMKLKSLNELHSDLDSIYKDTIRNNPDTVSDSDVAILLAKVIVSKYKSIMPSELFDDSGTRVSRLYNVTISNSCTLDLSNPKYSDIGKLIGKILYGRDVLDGIIYRGCPDSGSYHRLVIHDTKENIDIFMNRVINKFGDESYELSSIYNTMKNNMIIGQSYSILGERNDK